MAKTSDRVSSIAAKYRQITIEELVDKMYGHEGGIDEVVADLRTMSASLHRQDEHKGLRATGLTDRIKRALGR